MCPLDTSAEAADDNAGINLSALVNGDGQAWKNLIERHECMIFGLCRKHLIDYHDAEDASQQVWILAFKNIKSLHDSSCLTTWLMKITINHCIDTLRKPCHQETGHDGYEQHARTVRSLLCATESQLVDLQSSVRDIIEQMSPNHAEILRLRLLDGYSPIDAANRIEISVQTAKSRFNRAVEAFVELATEEFGTDFLGPRRESVRRTIDHSQRKAPNTVEAPGGKNEPAGSKR
jgi:RNA polymerase sigma-70 factor (ECF subfamily)